MRAFSAARLRHRTKTVRRFARVCALVQRRMQPLDCSTSVGGQGTQGKKRNIKVVF